MVAVRHFQKTDISLQCHAPIFSGMQGFGFTAINISLNVLNNEYLLYLKRQTERECKSSTQYAGEYQKFAKPKNKLHTVPCNLECNV